MVVSMTAVGPVGTTGGLALDWWCWERQEVAGPQTMVVASAAAGLSGVSGPVTGTESAVASASKTKRHAWCGSMKQAIVDARWSNVTRRPGGGHPTEEEG